MTLINSDKSYANIREILIKHGQSIGCFDWNDIISIDVDQSSLLTLAILKKDIITETLLIDICASYDIPDETGRTPRFNIRTNERL